MPIVTYMPPVHGPRLAIDLHLPNLSSMLSRRGVSQNETASTNPEQESASIAPVIGGIVLVALICALFTLSWLIFKSYHRIPTYMITIRNTLKFRSRKSTPVVAATQPEGLRYSSHDDCGQAAPRHIEGGHVDIEMREFVEVPLYDEPREPPPVYRAWRQSLRRPVASQLVREPGESRANILPPPYSAM